VSASASSSASSASSAPSALSLLTYHLPAVLGSLHLRPVLAGRLWHHIYIPVPLSSPSHRTLARLDTLYYRKTAWYSQYSHPTYFLLPIVVHGLGIWQLEADHTYHHGAIPIFLLIHQREPKPHATFALGAVQHVGLTTIDLRSCLRTRIDDWKSHHIIPHDTVGSRH